jgi:hypothetical protein
MDTWRCRLDGAWRDEPSPSVFGVNETNTCQNYPLIALPVRTYHSCNQLTPKSEDEGPTGILQDGGAFPNLQAALFMPSSNLSYAVASVDRIKQEIDELTRTQSRVLDLAVYVGMTPVEEQAFMARRNLIRKLLDKLRVLESE